MKTVALIPIRAGSKGIPGKNMKEMCGKPLCFWVIDAALNAESIDEVWVSTDSQCYIELIEDGFGEQVRTLMRPEWLATDTATSDDVLRHFCWEVCEPEDRVVMLQATSPLTTPDDIDGAVALCIQPWYTALSVVECNRFFWGRRGASYNLDDRPTRDRIEETYLENGAIYVSGVHRIMGGGARVDIKPEFYVMPQETATEIDTPEDWDIVEKLLEARLS